MLKTLRAQIIIMITIPLLGLLFTSLVSILEKRETSQQYRLLLPLAQVSKVASEVIHELQKERGMTVGLITSGYAEANRETLTAQRALTQPAIDRFLQVIKDTNIRVLDPELIEFIDDLIRLKGLIPDHRLAVDNKEIAVPDNVIFYTKIIEDLVIIISKAVEASPSEKLTHDLLPYLALVEVKEAAGLERAIGAAVFNDTARGNFQMKRYLGYYEKLAAEKAFMSEFKHFANKAQYKLYTDTVQGADVDQVMEWRKVLAEMPISKNTQGISGKEWFEAATKRINLIYQVEQAIGDDSIKVANELAAKVKADQIQLIIIDAILFVIASVVAIFVGTRISKGLGSVTHDIRILSGGDHKFTVAMTERPDEFGEIARALEIFRQNHEERELLARKATETQHRAEQERISLLTEMAASFEETVGHALKKLGQQTSALEGVSKHLSKKAEEGGSRSLTVAEAALETSTSVQGVALNGQEMSETINEVAHRISETTANMKSVVEQVDDATQRISSLQQASDAIGSVVQLITDIAGQTNLLALNATIEAARAGDAGKGFAVVAAEVKNLSTQTESATARIAEEIKSIQGQTLSAAESMRLIESSIRNTDEVVSGIAAAVEEQSMTTRQISESMEEISHAANTVTDEISFVCQSAAGSSGAGIQVLWSVDDLNALRAEIQGAADQFVVDLRNTGGKSTS